MSDKNSRWKPLTNELKAINLMMLVYLLFGILMFCRAEFLLLKILELLEK